TSATLGGTDDQLRQFAATIFSRDVDNVALIRGQKTCPDLGEIVQPAKEPTPGDLAAPLLTTKTLEPDPETGKPRLVTSPDACEALRSRLATLTAVLASAEKRPAALLADSLAHAPLIHRTQRILAERERLRLAELSQELWGQESQQALQATV